MGERFARAADDRFGRFARVATRVLALAAAWCGVILAFGPSSAVAQGGRPNGPSGYYVTFVARWCPAYTDIFANRQRNDIVESLKDLGPDTQYDESGVLVNPLYEDIPPQTNCHPIPSSFAAGWEFTLGSGYESRAVSGVWGSLSKVTEPIFDPQGYPHVSTIETRFATLLLNQSALPVFPPKLVRGAVTIQLTNAERRQANNPDSLWVQGGTPTDPVLAQKFYQTVPGDPAYAFGTLRCATDNLNGDNVEYIYFPAGVRHVFCYAYYVKPPPTSGTITIEKKVVGAPAGADPAFPFDGSITFDPHGFQLKNGQSVDFYRAGGAVWTVTEGAVDGYQLYGLSCRTDNGTSKFSLSVPTATVTIHLAALDHVTCFFINRYVPPSGGLTITKTTRGGVGTFQYRVTPASGGHSHRATATTTEPNVPVNATPSPLTLAPGKYTIREGLPTSPDGRWRLVSVICNGTSFSKPPVTVTITAGSAATCQFVNRFIPRGSISLAKITQGATGKASFQISPLSGTPADYLQTATTTAQGVAADAVPNTPADATDHLRLGSYRIVEQLPASIPAGAWTLTEISCNGVLQPFDQGAVTVTLTRSQPTMHCVFTDTFTEHPPPVPPPEPPVPPPPGPPAPPGPQPDVTYADLAVTKHASPPVVTQGGIVTYRLTVTNHGPDDATRVVLDDKPLGSAVVVSVHTNVGSCTSRVPITCQLGTLKPHAKVSITVRLRVTGHASPFTNRAVVGSATDDPNLANNVASATIRVVAPPPPSGLG